MTCNARFARSRNSLKHENTRHQKLNPACGLGGYVYRKVGVPKTNFPWPYWKHGSVNLPFEVFGRTMYCQQCDRLRRSIKASTELSLQHVHRHYRRCDAAPSLTCQFCLKSDILLQHFHPWAANGCARYFYPYLCSLRAIVGSAIRHFQCYLWSTWIRVVCISWVTCQRESLL